MIDGYRIKLKTFDSLKIIFISKNTRLLDKLLIVNF